MEPPAPAGSEQTKPDRHSAAPLLLDLQTPGLIHGYAKTPFASLWEVCVPPCVLLRDVGHVANDTCVPLGLREGLHRHGNTAEKFIHTGRCVRISARQDYKQRVPSSQQSCFLKGERITEIIQV